MLEMLIGDGFEHSNTVECSFCKTIAIYLIASEKKETVVLLQKMNAGFETRYEMMLYLLVINLHT